MWLSQGSVVLSGNPKKPKCCLWLSQLLFLTYIMQCGNSVRKLLVKHFAYPMSQKVLSSYSDLHLLFFLRIVSRIKVKFFTMICKTQLPPPPGLSSCQSHLYYRYFLNLSNVTTTCQIHLLSKTFLGYSNP